MNQEIQRRILHIKAISPRSHVKLNTQQLFDIQGNEVVVYTISTTRGGNNFHSPQEAIAYLDGLLEGFQLGEESLIPKLKMSKFYNPTPKRQGAQRKRNSL